MTQPSEAEMRHATAVLHAHGWIVLGDKPLGGGGGAWVYRVLSRAMRDRLIPAIRFFGEGQAAETAATALAEDISNILVGDAVLVAAAKVAKKTDHRMKREIDILRDVQHPNLIPLVAAPPTDEKEPGWYVMPLMRGSLEDLATSFVGDFRRVLRGLVQVASALAKLHDRDIYHRDTKPKNVFLDREENWVLGDPGIAYRDDGGDETTTNIMSRDWFPRWYDDEYGHQPRVDLYMLGMLGFFLLGGARVKDPSHVRKDRHDLAAKFPHAAIARDVHDLLCSLVKADPEEMVFTNATELLPHLEALLQRSTASGYASHEALIEPRLLFSYAATQLVRSEAPGLNQIPVFIPHRCEQLIVWAAGVEQRRVVLDLIDFPSGSGIKSTGPLRDRQPVTMPIIASECGRWFFISVRALDQSFTGELRTVMVFANGEHAARSAAAQKPQASPPPQTPPPRPPW